MAELLVARFDSGSNRWEHNHAEGETGTEDDGKAWLEFLKLGEVPKGKFCKWDKVLSVTDDWIEVENFRYGPYKGPDAGKLIHMIPRARLSVRF